MLHRIYREMSQLTVGVLSLMMVFTYGAMDIQAAPGIGESELQVQERNRYQQQQRRQPGRSVITGQVISTSTETPLVGANIFLVGTNLGTMTDTNGRFVLRRIPAGEYTLRARMMGYTGQDQALAVQAGDTVAVRFTLESSVLRGETVVVTGTRTPRYVKDVPVKTQVVTASELRNRNPANILEAAEQAAVGIDASMECSICNVASISLQGMPGRYTQVLIDGIPQYSSLGQMYTYMQLPSNFVDQVEIVKGANSALYGTDAISGIVNLQTKSPGLHPEMNIDMQLGQQGERRLSGAASFRKDKLGVLITGEYYNIDGVDRDRDGISEFSAMNRGYMNGKAVYEFTQNTNLQLRVAGTSEGRQGGMISGNGSIIEVLSEEEARGLSETIFTNRIEGSGILEHRFGPRSTLKLKSNLAHHFQDSDYEGFIYVADQYMSYNEVQYSQQIGNSHNFTGGVAYRTETLDENAAISEYEYHIGSAFGQFNWVPNNTIEMVAGLRWDHHNVYGHNITPSVSMRAWLSGNWAARLSYGEGFRAPTTFYELDHGTGAKYKYNIRYFADKAERSRSVTLSLDYGDFRHSLSISPFYHWINNYITAYNDAENERFVVRNVGELSRFYGIEGEYDYILSDEISMMVGYIFQRIAIDSEVLGFARPEHRLKWSLDYNNRSTGLACNLNGSITGPMELKEVYGTAYNSDGSPKIERSPAFAVVNAEIGKAFGGGFQVSVGAKNLFDFNQAEIDGPLMFNEQGVLEDVVYIWGPLLGRRFYARLTVNLE